ncbi:MAG TPA: hemerythrin domain-containing protein [Candidatus Acidoferrales bacterium]|jgi:hemerythrin-like domain-containing protein|nr:hemerythrin domain-containing protein [Candidatus Acidoferrales bacterium]
MLRDPSLIPLSQQHHNGLVLCILTRRALAEDGSPENAAKQVRRVIDRYELELANHFEIEEQVLFPECGPMPIISELVGEHRAMEALIVRLRAGSLSGGPTAALLEEFCALLSQHIRREENELFQQVQAVLPREVLDRLGGEIDRRAVRICL